MLMSMNGGVKITKEQIKSEIDRVGDEYLGALYRIVLALEEPVRPGKDGVESDDLDWSQFVSEMYGCMADAPLERGEQGVPESRLTLE
jgi:hypothetical protein